MGSKREGPWVSIRKTCSVLSGFLLRVEAVSDDMMYSSIVWETGERGRLDYLCSIQVLRGPAVKGMILEDELGLKQREMEAVKSVMGGG